MAKAPHEEKPKSFGTAGGGRASPYAVLRFGFAWRLRRATTTSSWDDDVLTGMRVRPLFYDGRTGEVTLEEEESGRAPLQIDLD